MREAPALSAIASKTSAGSSPAISPSTKASAAARLWIVTRWLAMNFIRLPLPKAPTYFCEHLAAALERRFVATGKDDEVLSGRLGASAAHRAVEQDLALRRELRLPTRLHLDRQGAAFDDDLALAVTRGDAALARHHLVEGIDIG